MLRNAHATSLNAVIKAQVAPPSLPNLLSFKLFTSLHSDSSKYQLLLSISIMRTSSLTGMLSQQHLNAARVGSRTYGRRMVLQARGYAAPAKPTGSTGVSGLDADLWKSYNAGLRNFVFSGNKLNPKTQAFFTAPVGTMGIPAGQNIPQPITNSALYQVADSLLDTNSPVFTPGNAGSYVDRQLR